MPLLKDERVFVEKGLYGELQGQLGRNFDTYQQAVNVHAQQRRQRGAMGSTMGSTSGSRKSTGSKIQASFPPLLSTFTLRQTKQAVAKETKPIAMTDDLRANLEQVLGDKNVRMLEDQIGFQAKSAHEIPVVSENPPPVFHTVFGDRPKPQYKFTSRPHQTKIKGKFFWPNMTNELCAIPVDVKKPSNVQDLKSWLDTYGEPSTDRIPTGSMTTFKASRRRFGKDKSRGSELLNTATGADWKREFDKTREMAALSMAATR
jgi:hypothetical protein